MRLALLVVLVAGAGCFVQPRTPAEFVAVRLADCCDACRRMAWRRSTDLTVACFRACGDAYATARDNWPAERAAGSSEVKR